MAQLEPGSPVVASREQATSSIADEVVILASASRRCFDVDGMNARIWELVRSLAVVSVRVCADEVNFAVCRAGLYRVLPRMIDAKLGEVRPATGS